MFKVIILLCLFSGSVFANTPDTITLVTSYNIFDELHQSSENGGGVQIKGDPDIMKLVELHTAINNKQKTISGYRIQIFSGSSYDYSMSKLQTIKTEFEKEFPSIPVYLNYFDPDFKIRAGNYRSRLECIPALKVIRHKYPSSYPVKTDIPTSDLQKTTEKKVQDSEAEN